MVRLEQMADDVTPVWMTKLLEVLFKKDLDELTSLYGLGQLLECVK